jgi:hypothetical protein
LIDYSIKLSSSSNSTEIVASVEESLSKWRAQSKSIENFLDSVRLWDSTNRWENLQTRSQRTPQYRSLTDMERLLFEAVETNDLQKFDSLLHELESSGDDASNDIGALLNNARIPKSQASLLHVGASNGSLMLVRRLLSRGVAVDCKAANDSTPLHWASGAGQLAVVEELVNCGANVNATTNAWKTDSLYGKSSGQTPLHWAAEAAHLHVVMYLMHEGAVASAEDERGKSASDVSADELVTSAMREHRSNARYVCVRLRTVPFDGFATEFSTFINNFMMKRK